MSDKGDEITTADLQRVNEMNEILAKVCLEAESAVRINGEFNSMHEAWAVILEEEDELWEIVRQKRSARDPDRILHECIQIAASAVKTAHKFGRAGYGIEDLDREDAATTSIARTILTRDEIQKLVDEAEAALIFINTFAGVETKKAAGLAESLAPFRKDWDEDQHPEDGITCPKCHGSGSRGVPGVDCGACVGTGKIAKSLPEVPGPPNPPRPEKPRDGG